MVDPERRDMSAKPIRRERGKRPPFIKGALIGSALLTGGMLIISVPNLVMGDGFWLAVKTALLATGGTLISYAVNKLAVERGAPLATAGYSSAGVTSVVAIAVVGSGLASATYFGLVSESVSSLRIQDHGTILTEYVADRSQFATQAGRIGPVVDTIIADLTQKRDCEIRTSCVSRRDVTGRGPVTRAIEEKLERASAIALQIERGNSNRRQALERANQTVGQYQASAGNEDADAQAQRVKLQELDLKLRQDVNELSEAVPLALLYAYADDLKAGASVPGNPEGTRNLNAILRSHGEATDAILSGIDDDATPPSPFPKRTGVADTWGYIGHFAPIAAITVVVEMVFPMVLWILTYLGLHWGSYRESPPAAKDWLDEDPLDEFLPHLRKRKVDPTPLQEKPRRNRRHSVPAKERHAAARRANGHAGPDAV